MADLEAIMERELDAMNTRIIILEMTIEKLTEEPGRLQYVA